jgi:hypothetical protein
MTTQEHCERYKLLHGYLDELVADFIRETGKLPTKCTIMELMEWNNKQITEAK